MTLLVPIPFTPEMNWNAPLTEERSYETVLTEFYDGTEQREALKTVPDRRLSYQISAFGAQEAGFAEALVYAGQALHFWVPFWRGATWLHTPLAATDTTLALTTADLGYEVGQGLMLIQVNKPTINEVTVLTDVAADALEFEALTLDWAASGRTRARIVPCYRGYIAPSIGFDYPERSAKEFTVTFDLVPDGD